MAAGRLPLLTPRERQVLEHRATGLPYKQIGAQLGISLNTVKHHLCRSFVKLGVSSSIEAVRKLRLS